MDGVQGPAPVRLTDRPGRERQGAAVVPADRERNARGSTTGAAADDPRTWDADQAVTVLHAAHYRSLVRTAWLLLGDAAAAEDVVQDAFVGLHRAWPRLREPANALHYLHRSTVNGARSGLRRRRTVTTYAPVLVERDEAADLATGVAEAAAVAAALAALPARQREVLVLRYYGDLSEQAIADLLGISPGTVKVHAARGLAALRPILEQVR
jgi:RNA polymerase sigma-70 factor (sigma-E family)